MQPPCEEYWSFQCTNYPAWPWMSLWTTVSLWSTCLDGPALPFLRKKERSCCDYRIKSMSRFWLLIFVKHVWHLLKWPICLSAVTSCAIQWALNLADQHLCVGVYVAGQYLHMRPCIWDYSVCLCVCECGCVHAPVGKSTGRYILLCHHLCSGRQQATSYTLTLYIQTHSSVCVCLFCATLKCLQF